MLKAGKLALPDQVRLRDQVLPRRQRIIGGQLDRAIRSIDGTRREDVLVELVIVAIENGRAQLQRIRELMFKNRRERIDGHLTRAQVRVAVERFLRSLKRPAIDRRHPAIGHALIHKMLRRQTECGFCTERERRAGRKAVAFGRNLFAVTVRLLVERIDPCIDTVRERAAQIAARPRIPEGTNSQGQGAGALAVRLLRDPVDDPAARSPAKDQP